jgi:hypothetical protein
MKITPVFAWYDLWVGAFWDKVRRCLYLFPVPTLGVKIDFAVPEAEKPLGKYECAPGAGCSWCDTGRAVAHQRAHGIPGDSGSNPE